MKKTTIIIALILIIISCKKNNFQNTNDYFNKSFKELKQKEDDTFMLENMDTVFNLYSNYKYSVAFDGPDNWEYDYGASEHSIFNIYQLDSAVFFNIIVMDLKVNKKKETNIWEVYLNNKKQMDNDFKWAIKSKLKSDFEIGDTRKVYIKNNIAIRKEIDYIARDLDYELDKKMIIYETFRNGNNYTFSLDLPLVFYEKTRDIMKIFSEIYYG